MSSNEVKVGALTLGGIGLLAGIITFLGAFSFSGSGYKLQISYPQVGGLMPGHVVRYAAHYHIAFGDLFSGICETILLEIFFALPETEWFKEQMVS